MEMQWLLLFWLFNTFKVTMTGTDTDLYITRRECGKIYDMARYDTVELNYNGYDLGTDKCTVEFLNEDSRDRIICVSAQKVSIGCNTKLEYHGDFVKDYLEPEKRITCGESTLDEWCSEQYTDRVFIVIRKSAGSSDDVFQLLLHRKELEDNSERYVFSSSSVLWVTLVPTALIMTTCAFALCIAYNRKAQRMDATRAQYQTTSGAVTVQTGQGHSTPSQPGTRYQPVPQQVGSQQLPSGYHIHAMQTAVPVNQNVSQVAGYQSQLAPSAPLGEGDSSAPPQYDSLFPEK